MTPPLNILCLLFHSYDGGAHWALEPREVILNPNQAGGGQICPTDFQTLIPLEPNVGFTPNQAVNSSLSVV